MKPGDQIAGDVFRAHRLLPRHHADDAEIHGDVKSADDQDRRDDGAGNGRFGLYHLVAHIAYGVVAGIGVHRVQSGGSPSPPQNTPAAPAAPPAPPRKREGDTPTPTP